MHLDTGQIYTFASIFIHFVFQPWLIRRLKVHDTCGVNSLHGLPGILGAVAGTISSSIAGYKQYKTRYGFDQTNIIKRYFLCTQSFKIDEFRVSTTHYSVRNICLCIHFNSAMKDLSTAVQDTWICELSV